MQINRLVQNSCKYGMRVAIPRVYIHTYDLSIMMPVSIIWTEGACQRTPSMTKATKHRGKSSITIDILLMDREGLSEGTCQRPPRMTKATY